MKQTRYDDESSSEYESSDEVGLSTEHCHVQTPMEVDKASCARENVMHWSTVLDDPFGMTDLLRR